MCKVYRCKTAAGDAFTDAPRSGSLTRQVLGCCLVGDDIGPEPIPDLIEVRIEARGRSLDGTQQPVDFATNLGIFAMHVEVLVPIADIEFQCTLEMFVNKIPGGCSSRLVGLEGSEQVSLCSLPVSFHGSDCHTECLGRVGDAQAGEKATLDDSLEPWIDFAYLLHSVIECQHRHGVIVRHEPIFLQRQWRIPVASLGRVASARMIHEQVSHDLRSGP